MEPGAARAVSVTYDDNLQDKIIAEVVGDTLELSQEGNVSTFRGWTVRHHRRRLTGHYFDGRRF